jgi:hypothetical protein
MRYWSDDSGGDRHKILRVWVVGGNCRQVMSVSMSAHSTFRSTGGLHISRYPVANLSSG